MTFGGTAPNQPTRTHTCPWCGLVTDGTQLSCPACGATVDVESVVTNSGWTELPGRRDMAKLQFGSSHCQIEGTYVPVADFNLSPADGILPADFDAVVRESFGDVLDAAYS